MTNEERVSAIKDLIARRTEYAIDWMVADYHGDGPTAFAAEQGIEEVNAEIRKLGRFAPVGLIAFFKAQRQALEESQPGYIDALSGGRTVAERERWLDFHDLGSWHTRLLNTLVESLFELPAAEYTRIIKARTRG